MNAKHPIWNSHSANTVGNILFQHVTQSDYSITAPNSLIHFPDILHYHLDVLDTALSRLPFQITEISNLNKLSSDHNPILLTIPDSPISASSPHASLLINWKKVYFNYE